MDIAEVNITGSKNQKEILHKKISKRIGLKVIQNSYS